MALDARSRRNLTVARPRPAAAGPAIRRAACTGRPAHGTNPFIAAGLLPPGVAGQGASADRTLVWSYTVASNGARIFTARLWNGREYDDVVDDRVAAPVAPPAPPSSPSSW